MATKNSWIVALAILMGALLSASAAQAEDTATTASEHYQTGQREFALGHWDAAIAAFERAYVLQADPAFLFNLAQCFDRKGDARRAIDLFRAYLNNAPSNSFRQAIGERIRLLQRQLDIATGAKPAPLPPAPRAPEPPAPSAASEGSPHLSPPTATAPDALPASSVPPASTPVTSPDPAAPEAGPVSPSGTPSAQAAPLSPTVDPPPSPIPHVAQPHEPAPAAFAGSTGLSGPEANLTNAPSQPQVARSGRGLRVAGVVCGTSAIVFFAAGAIFSLQTKSYSNAVEGDAVFDPSKADTGALYEKLQWTSYGIGAGLAVTGAVLYWVGATSNQGTSTSVALVPVAGGTVFSAKGVF